MDSKCENVVTMPDALMVVTTRKAAAEARVEAALAAIQQAQRLIERATQALSAVNGMRSEWKRLGTLHDRVREAWYDVTGKSDSLLLKGRLVLDHEPDSHEAQWAAGHL